MFTNQHIGLDPNDPKLALNYENKSPIGVDAIMIT